MRYRTDEFRSAGKTRGQTGLAVQSLTAPRWRETHLTRPELEEFRQSLLASRRKLAGDIARLQDQALRQGRPGGNGGSSPLAHQVPGMTDDMWEQLLALCAIDNKRSLLREIDQALDRIDKNVYGICMSNRKAISKSRLREVPWAKYCRECADKRPVASA